MRRILHNKGHSVTFQYVNTPDPDSFDLVFNRVMPSIAAKDHNFHQALYKEYLEELEKSNAIVINSLNASIADIDKLFSTDCMKEQEIPTPKMYKANFQSIDMITQKLGFPIIRKPSMSGRSGGVIKCNNMSELTKALLIDDIVNGYVVLQEYIESVVPHDYRVLVCNGKILFAISRSLVDGWMGSISKGSKAFHLTSIPTDMEKLAIEASKSIGAVINGIDIVVGKDGPVVIENNPTPNFRKSYIDMVGFNPVEKIIVSVLEEIK
jgi:glutathione synthase/RimK-type ligase-like ATP-grasp enzyme